MNRVNNQLYSMTRSTSVKDPVVCQHPHWSAVDGVPSLLPNKKPFHITRIVRRNSECEDGANVEEKMALNSSNFDGDKMPVSSKEHNATVAEHHLPLADILNKEIRTVEDGVQSRFRVVKIESKGLFKRGRWTCRDFADPPEAKASDVAETQSVSASSEPVFYVQGAAPDVSQLIFYSEGHPVLESDALPCASKLFIDEIASSLSTADTGRQTDTDSAGGLKSSDVAIANCDVTERMSLPAGTSSLLSLVVDDTNELTVTAAAATSGSTSEIDSKIEQAMDLVKTHLMLAVRAEIEDLKEQIKQLMLKNHHLEYENQVLRAAADHDLLASLDYTAPDTDCDNGS